MEFEIDSQPKKRTHIAVAYDGTQFFPYLLRGFRRPRYCVAERDPDTGNVILHEFPRYADVEFAADWARHLANKHDPAYTYWEPKYLT